MKPVGGRIHSGAVRLVVGKPRFHRHEAGWGTLHSVQQTILSGIQIFNSSHSIKTKVRIPPLATDWTDRTPRQRPPLRRRLRPHQRLHRLRPRPNRHSSPNDYLLQKMFRRSHGLRVIAADSVRKHQPRIHHNFRRYQGHHRRRKPHPAVPLSPRTPSV